MAGFEGQRIIDTLSEAGFAPQNPGSQMPGTPQKLKITNDTITKLTEIMNAGKGLAVTDNGEIEIVSV